MKKTVGWSLDRGRARRIRRRLRAGDALSDIDRVWFASYETRPSVRRCAKRDPTQAIPPILMAVCREFHVTPDELRRPGRTRLQVEVARAALAVALYMAGCPRPQAAEILGRSPPSVTHMTKRARARASTVELARSILVTARGAVAGDVVMVPIVVGSAAWQYLDRQDELDDRTAAALRHRSVALMIDHAVGAE